MCIGILEVLQAEGRGGEADGDGLWGCCVAAGDGSPALRLAPTCIDLSKRSGVFPGYPQVCNTEKPLTPPY